MLKRRAWKCAGNDKNVLRKIGRQTCVVILYSDRNSERASLLNRLVAKLDRAKIGDRIEPFSRKFRENVLQYNTSVRKKHLHLAICNTVLKGFEAAVRSL